MKSRVHPKYKTKYRVRNWASYERALIGRGNITIWLSRAAIAAWTPEGPRTRGAPPKYSDLAIETALTLRLLFHLPLRQAEGFLTSLFHLMGLDLRSPDHTTLSRRGQHLNLTLRRAQARCPAPLHRQHWPVERADGHGGRCLRHAFYETGAVVVPPAKTTKLPDATRGRALAMGRSDSTRWKWTCGRVRTGFRRQLSPLVLRVNDSEAVATVRIVPPSREDRHPRFGLAAEPS